MNQNISLFIAFGGGVLAFFSPCFLPLVPAYLVYITGLSFEEVKNVRLKTIIHSLLFIAGFTFIFTLLGSAAGLLGDLLFNLCDLLRVLGGGFLILLGFYLIGLLKLPFLDIERKMTLAAKPSGYLGTFIVGMVFALGWSPCVGPVLAGILTLAAQSGMAGQGALLLVAFSLGLGLPLFLASLAVDHFISLLKQLQDRLPLIHRIAGVFLVIVGLLLAADYFKIISFWLMELTGYGGL
ncbi:MAG: sulfite exporter TauE/SafE family protein [Candidatus Saganbacteria bacterium]|nr:sulfite exporter TauE/SafE family protein [Candidatus Saganbacteria bacterium]